MHYKYSLDGTISALTDALYKFLSLVGLLATIAANSNQRAMCLHITLIFHMGQGARAGVLTLVRPIKQHPVVRSTVVRYVILPHHGFERVHGFGISFAENINNTKGGTDEQCHDTLATTAFLDSGNVVRGSYDTSVLEDDITMKLESVTDFLSKPLNVATFAWSTADIKNTVLTSKAVGATILANTQWMNKLQGFNLLRGTACMRIQVNANPFQQGKLLVHFLPGYSNFNALDPSYGAMHNATIATKRQQPCVEVDCRDAVGVLEMPYISPDNWFVLNSVSTDSRDWGTFFISVLSPLAVGAAGETTVDVSVYMYICDAEVAAPIVPQMAGGPKSKFKAKTVGRKDLEALEAESLLMTPVAAGLKAASVGVGILGGIPMLSPYAAPASWALDLASGVASFLGWSKVPNNQVPTIVSQQYNRYLATSEGSENAAPLALRSDNKISVSDALSVYSEDELSMNFLKSVSTCFKTVSWTTSNAQDVVILDMFIGPSKLFESATKTIGAHVATYGCGPPIYYLHNKFSFWRGGIEVTFKVVKTDFHIGRLQLTWTPSIGNINPPVGATDSMLSLREIIDVRENNVFTFTLPWLLAPHYISTLRTSGRLVLTVLNELRAPETCSQAVEVLVYARAAPDFEFQAPGYSLETGRAGDVQLPFSPQTADDLEVSDGVGGEKSGTVGTSFGQACNGEAIMSLKQFLNRGTYLCFKAGFGGTSLGFYPWTKSVLFMTAVTGVRGGANVGGDALCFIAPMYALYRGSANVQLTTTSGNVNALNATLYLKDISTATNVMSSGVNVLGNQGTNDWTISTSAAGLNGYTIFNGGLGTCAVRVPYYCSHKCSYNIQNTTSDACPVDGTTPSCLVNFNGLNTTTTYSIFRSFPDDFQLTYFVGAPPLLISYT